MHRTRQVAVRRYRGFALEVRDERGAGWSVTIYAPRAGACGPVKIHNAVPNGLPLLLDEARHRIDRTLDGPRMACPL